MTEFRNFLTDFGNLLIVIRANEKLSVEDMALEKIMSSLTNLAIFIFIFFFSSILIFITTKKILERLRIQISSSFVKI